MKKIISIILLMSLSNLINAQGIGISISSAAKSLTTPSICMVSANEAGTFYEIYWDETLYGDAKTVIIYRNVGGSQYEIAGRIGTNVRGYFLDVKKPIDPNETAQQYKIQTVDANDNLSAASPIHQTIFIKGNGNGEFSWNAYIVTPRNAGNKIEYNLWRMDAQNNKTFVLKTTDLVATDPDFKQYQGKNYKWFITLEGFSCDTGKTGTKSNNSNE